MLSLRAYLAREISRQMFRRIKPDSELGKLRDSFESLGARLRAPRDVAVRHATIDGVQCEWLIPAGCDSAPVIYYIHGGAFLMGSPRTHRRMVAYIARAAGMRALLPDYALAPEHPFPAGLNDVLRVYRALPGNGVRFDDVHIGGDSAGGNLAVAMLLSVRDAGEALPASGFLLSPLLDLTFEGESASGNAGRDPWFKPGHGPAIAQRYCSADEVRDPLVSPVFADAANLPPLLIHVGDVELLLSDATRFADNMETAGSRVTLKIWPGLWHVFHYSVGHVPESTRAVEEIASFLRS